MDTALESIKLLPKQIEQTWQEVNSLSLPKTLQGQELIAVSGMGGSIYNYYFLESVFKTELKKALLKVNNYGLAKCIGENSLFVASSYSGTTEEVVFNTKQALEKKANIVIFSAGGPLIELAKEHSLPYYLFEPKHNPSGQPRMGQGYMLFGLLGLLNNLGYLSEAPDLSFLTSLEKQTDSLYQQAKGLASKLHNQELFFVGADHLSANAHILRNQTNETAKLYANYNLIPELNHHLMEGLKHPDSRNKVFVFLESGLYQKRNQQRFQLTKEVIKKNGYQVMEFVPKSTSKLSQFVEALIWGGYLTYELGNNYGEDPNKIPWVDYFKNNLPKI
jgi:glucose/mannose-6-phosphate isomerase